MVFGWEGGRKTLKAEQLLHMCVLPTRWSERRLSKLQDTYSQNSIDPHRRPKIVSAYSYSDPIVPTQAFVLRDANIKSCSHHEGLLSVDHAISTCTPSRSRGQAQQDSDSFIKSSDFGQI